MYKQIFAFMLLVVTIQVIGNSAGLETPICDALDERVWVEYMWWVTPPERTNTYTVRTGDGDPKDDVKSYIPEQYLDVHIRTHSRNQKFVGLLLYAVDWNETKVGGWDLPIENPYKFHTPAGSCEGKAIMHSGANLKNYHHSFRFKSPPKNTGNITFRALVKFGPANIGSFYWPNLDGPLQLQEKDLSGVPDQVWFKGSGSCNGICRNTGLGCNEAALRSVSTSHELQNVVNDYYACKLPILTGSYGHAVSDPEGFCYYQNVSTKSENLCKIESNLKDESDQLRFCPCHGVPISSSSSSSFSTFVVVFSGILVAFQFGSFATFLTLLLIIPSYHAHNWINNPSRSPKINTVKPCPPRDYLQQAHMQINPGIKFPIEWATGHQRTYHYFSLIRAEDEEQLAIINRALLEDYIKDRPDDNYMSGKEYNQIHIGTEKESTYSKKSIFTKQLNSTPGYQRGPRFANRNGGSLTYWEYKSDVIEPFAFRVNYKNSKYPWLIAVHRYKVISSLPKDSDIAQFEIPDGSSSGKYIIQWQWNGYYDCIDIDVVDPALSVTDVWGTLISPIMVRIDHCRFTQYAKVAPGTTCHRVKKGDPATPCIDGCMDAKIQKCDGVNLHPYTVPSIVPFNYTPPMLSYCRNKFALSDNKKKDWQLCYGFKVGEGNDEGPPWKITDDPEDPDFYSTCFRRVYPRRFSGNTCGDACLLQQKPSPPWRFADQCVSCKMALLNDEVDIGGVKGMAPYWDLAEKCHNCDREPWVDDRSFKQISQKGRCCQNNAAEITRNKSGTMRRSTDCEPICSRIPECKFFSHSTYENCIYCSECKLVSSGTGAQYTSWEKKKNIA